MRKAHYHQKQGRFYYPNYQRTITTNRKKFYSLLIAGFFVLMLVGVTNTYGGVSPSGILTESFSMGESGVAYSSQGGWSVASPGAITRETKWGVPSYTVNDIFLLNGLALVYSHTGSSSERIYHAEIESYEKIEYHNSSTPSNSFWLVINKDGFKTWFGYDPDETDRDDARIEAVGKSGKIREWAAAKSKVSGGNSYAKYVYEGDINGTSDGDYYLAKVISGKSGASKYKATILTYEDKQQTGIISYTSGSRVKINKRLKTVEIKMGTDIHGSGGTPLGKYEIEYNYTDMKGFGLISYITEYGHDGANYTSPKPPTKFEYKIPVKSFRGDLENVDLGFWKNTGTCYVFISRSDGLERNVDSMDMNADGLPDMVSRLFYEDEHDETADVGYYVAFNNGSEFDNATDWGTNITDMYAWDSVRYTSSGKTYSDTIDIDGDGFPDKISYKKNGADGL